MFRREIGIRGCSECDLNGLQSSLEGRLSRRSKRSNAQTAVATVKSSQRKLFFDKALFSTAKKFSVDIHRILLAGRWNGRSHQPSTSLVVVRSSRLQRVILLFL